MSQAVCTWNDNTEPDLKEYWLFRSVNGAPEVQIATLAKGIHTYTDIPLPVIDGTIGYSLLAVDTSGNKSPHTLSVTKTVNLVPPVAPTGLDVVIS